MDDFKGKPASKCANGHYIPENRYKCFTKNCPWAVPTYVIENYEKTDPGFLVEPA